LGFGRRLAEELLNGRLEIIQGAGHSPSEDRPEQVTLLIAEFLAE
jgi:pimeloyl-ACP methyl ester carboxylesterase